MSLFQRLPRNVAAVLTFGRPPLVFAAFACALWVMFAHNPLAYMLGLLVLLLAAAFDVIDGWFAVRYIPHSRLGPLADRMMDRLVLTIIFPVLGAGMFWRLERLSGMGEAEARQALLHALFVLAIAVVVLMRDQLVQFLRNFAVRATEDGGDDVESFELTRLRTLMATPMAVLLYAHAFYLPTGGWEWFYRWVGWVDALPLRVWYIAEMFFLIINVVSITLHLRKYGRLALDDICEDDELLRRRILAVFPNALTLMNGLLGVTAMIFASYGRVREAVFILMGAAFFDRLDGTVARRLGLTEPLPEDEGKGGIAFGALLDDISDGISFAIAPGVIFYMVIPTLSGLGETGWPWGLIALVYVLAGFARLAYFTLDKTPIPGFFKGMPVPAAALLVSSAIEIAAQTSQSAPAWTFAAAATAGVMMLGAAVVMNLYPVHYLHIGRFMSRHPTMTWVATGISVLLVFTPAFGVALLAVMLAYVLSPLYTGHIDPSHAAMEQPQKAP